MAVAAPIRVRAKLLILCLTMMLAGAGLTAWAQTSSTPTHSGCLDTSTGTIVKVKRGSSPLSACGAGETSIKLSAGDIVEIVTATDSGLTGGVKSGISNLAINFRALDTRYEPASPATRACFEVVPDENLNLSYCHLQAKEWTGVTLIGSDLRFSDFDGAMLGGSVLSNVNMSRASLRFVDLRNAFMPNANLTRTNLFGSLMDGANVNGVTWQNTICPDGTVSNANGNTCVGHLTPTTP